MNRSEWPDGEPGEHVGKLAELVRAGAISQAVELCQAMDSPLDLRGAELGGVELNQAELIGADLRDADLRHAGLWAANLSGANLRGADLEGADLSYSELQGADLRGANLNGGAYLWGAEHDAQTRWPDGFDVGRATGEARVVQK